MPFLLARSDLKLNFLPRISNTDSENCVEGYICRSPLDSFGADVGRYYLRAQRRQTIQFLQMYGLIDSSPFLLSTTKLSQADTLDSKMPQKRISGDLYGSAHLLSNPQFKMKRNPRKLKWTKAFRVRFIHEPISERGAVDLSVRNRLARK